MIAAMVMYFIILCAVVLVASTAIGCMIARTQARIEYYRAQTRRIRREKALPPTITIKNVP